MLVSSEKNLNMQRSSNEQLQQGNCLSAKEKEKKKNFFDRVDFKKSNLYHCFLKF